jgi:hypothetical protein
LRQFVSFVFGRALSRGVETLSWYYFAAEIPISISIMSILQFDILVLGIVSGSLSLNSSPVTKRRRIL